MLDFEDDDDWIDWDDCSDYADYAEDERFDAWEGNPYWAEVHGYLWPAETASGQLRPRPAS